MERAFKILVTITIVVIGVVVSLPVLFRPSHGPNEPQSVSNLRTINNAEVTYLSSSGGIYGSMTDIIAAGLLDETFTGTVSGYKYTIAVGATGYTATALPASKETGRYGYYSVSDAVVRYSTNASLAPTGQSGRSVQQVHVLRVKLCM